MFILSDIILEEILEAISLDLSTYLENHTLTLALVY